MTDFQFNLFNHSPVGRESLGDVIDPIGAQMLDLGHRVNRCDEFFAGPPVVNVIAEGFNPDVIEVVADARRNIPGFKLIIIATERPSPLGFNNQTRGEMVARQKYFPEAARLADAVWCLVPEALSWMKAQNPRSTHVELGYSPRRVIPQVVPAEYDFGFFGSLTARRNAILAALRKRGHSVLRLAPIRTTDAEGRATVRLPDKAERNAAMQRCRIVLQLKPATNWQIVSSSRCNTAINLGRAVVAEPHNSDSVWKRIVRFSSTPFNFIKTAEDTLPDYESEWVRQFCRFRDLLPAHACVGRAIEETLPQ